MTEPKEKPKFHKLTPVSDADIGIYLYALDDVFENPILRNIAISGAYGAGKSSILESYKTKNDKKKFLHISLAHFEEANDSTDFQTERNSGSKRVETNESVLEGKIINQLIHQIPPNKIPQTNFRIKQKVEPIKVLLWVIGAVIFVLSFIHINFFASWKSYIDGISTAWIKSLFLSTTRNNSQIFSGAICVILASTLLYHAIMAQVNKSIIKKINADKFAIEIFEGSNESFFDKYLNEVLYLFEQCGADAIVFEDMDRYNANRIFERLREVNSIINTQRAVKGESKPLRFFYLIRDDIFVSKDRTKFFDFIIPIVPVIDGSNSYNQFIEHLTYSGIWGIFDESFLKGLSLYIDDMRILKNICNEFLIYNSCLNTIKLNPNKLMAMMAYKNLFPRDFSDLQLNRGFVHMLFNNIERFRDLKKETLSSKIQELEDRINSTKNENLVSSEEVDMVCNDKINKNNRNYEIKSSERTNVANEIEEERVRRKQAIEDSLPDKLQELENQIINIKSFIIKIDNEKLHEIITRDNIGIIFATTTQNDIDITSDYKDVRGNAYFDLLKYLIRNGYIDETFADYMTYFYENDLCASDKVFLRSLADQTPKEPSYLLKDPQKVLKQLDISAFKQPEVLNFDLLFYLLEAIALYYKDELEAELIDNNEKSIFPIFLRWYKTEHKEMQCLIRMVEQMKIQHCSFLEEIFLNVQDAKLNYLVNYLNRMYKECLIFILSQNATMFKNSSRDIFAFRSLIVTPQYVLSEQEEFRSAFANYISMHPELIDKEHFEDQELLRAFDIENFTSLIENVNVIGKLKSLDVRFISLDYDKANTVLFDGIYENRLYQLSFSNITYLLKAKCGLTETDDFKHRNYSLIKATSDSPLANYIESDIDSYTAVMLEACDGIITDDANAALAILNNANITDEHKKTYISLLATTIQTISDVDDRSLWQKLMETDSIAHTEKNVLDCFCFQEFAITKELIQFIDRQSNEFNYSRVRLEYEDDIQSKFFNAVLRCNNLNNSHYEQILKTLNSPFPEGFSITGIADDKILILINNDIIPMREDSLIFFRENYANAILTYIKKYISGYSNEIINDENFSLTETLFILESDVNDEYKLSLLKKTNEKLSANNPKYSDAVKAYILSENFDDNDKQHFISSYSNEGLLTKQEIEKIVINKINSMFIDSEFNEYNIDKGLVDKILSATDVDKTVKEKIFALLLPSLNEVQCKQYLTKLNLDPFAKLLNPENRIPKIAVSDINAMILGIFLERGWISGFDENSVKEGYYINIKRKQNKSKPKG